MNPTAHDLSTCTFDRIVILQDISEINMFWNIWLLPNDEVKQSIWVVTCDMLHCFPSVRHHVICPCNLKWLSIIKTVSHVSYFLLPLISSSHRHIYHQPSHLPCLQNRVMKWPCVEVPASLHQLLQLVLLLFVIYWVHYFFFFPFSDDCMWAEVHAWCLTSTCIWTLMAMYSSTNTVFESRWCQCPKQKLLHPK